MDIKNGLVDAIGNTPMIRLKKASEETGCEILGKCEFLNPGQSVKDRAALYIIQDAMAKGDLKPGGVIVEGTAGNTGIGLALVGNALGFRSVIVIPETQSQEKKDMLRLCGAELIEVPAVPYKDPNNYVRYSGRLAEELAAKEPNGAIWANQFDNVANRQAHIETTGPEIWNQTDGKVDGFICAVGTGGTLAGTGMSLKEKNKDIQIGLADPMGAALFNYYKNGELKAEGSSITEGIGQGRITANLEDAPIDHPFQIPDSEALPICFDLLSEEGLCLGGSSGINIAGAMRLAKEMGPGHTIVTILCDYGTRYQSKMFNPAFLKEQGLPLGRDTRREYEDRHIPGAVFLDLDEISDQQSPFPHMLPSPDEFSSHVGQLGLGNTHHVVIYDGDGLFSAARFWWMFRVMGHEKVSVLDGGLPKWLVEGRRTATGIERPTAQQFVARPNPAMRREIDDIERNLKSLREQVVDARSHGRFAGTDPEPRPELSSGHMPGSLSLPFGELLNEDGTLKPPADLRQTFERAGVDLKRPVVTTCGSGVTAAIPYLALTVLEHPNISLYDGSWSEWAATDGMPIQKS
eukprot:s1_g233.t1